VRFRYRLDGFDRDWNDAGTRRAAFYTNLAPGHYTFHVKACNNDSVWNDEGASLSFNLKPFFYQTRAFQILCGLGLIGLGAGAQRFRLHRMKVRQRQLERIVKEQTNDLRTTNEELRRVQEQLARLSEATPEKIENISGWGTSMAAEIARAIRAREITIWRADDGKRLVSLSGEAAKTPSWESVQAACSGTPPGTEGERIVPVRGMSGELRSSSIVCASSLR
jgi:hypothetical protein